MNAVCYLAVIKSIRGEPAQTSANCRQSSHAPNAKEERRPMWERTREAEQRLPRMDGWEISEM